MTPPVSHSVEAYSRVIVSPFGVVRITLPLPRMQLPPLPFVLTESKAGFQVVWYVATPKGSPFAVPEVTCEGERVTKVPAPSALRSLNPESWFAFTPWPMAGLTSASQRRSRVLNHCFRFILASLLRLSHVRPATLRS